MFPAGETQVKLICYCYVNVIKVFVWSLGIRLYAEDVSLYLSEMTQLKVRRILQLEICDLYLLSQLLAHQPIDGVVD